MVDFLQFVVNGMMIGGVYALIALGIVLICKSSAIFNFAVGEMTMVGAFLMWTFFDVLGLPFFVSIALTLIGSGFLGFIMQRLAIQPLIGQPLLSAMLVTLGLSYICLLYTSDAADDLLCVDLGGRRIIKKKITHIGI